MNRVNDILLTLKRRSEEDRETGLTYRIIALATPAASSVFQRHALKIHQIGKAFVELATVGKIPVPIMHQNAPRRLLDPYDPRIKCEVASLVLNGYENDQVLREKLVKCLNQTASNITLRNEVRDRADKDHAARKLARSMKLKANPGRRFRTPAYLPGQPMFA